MGRSTFSGPVRSEAGLEASTDSTTITKILQGTVSVTVAALAAAAEADVDVTVTGAAVGDMVNVCPTEAAAETGLSISAVWVSAANTVSIRMSNQSASGLTGSTANWSYQVMSIA